MRPSINNAKYTIKINLYVSFISLILITKDFVLISSFACISNCLFRSNTFSIKATAFDSSEQYTYFTWISFCSMVNTVWQKRCLFFFLCSPWSCDACHWTNKNPAASWYLLLWQLCSGFILVNNSSLLRRFQKVCGKVYSPYRKSCRAFCLFNSKTYLEVLLVFGIMMWTE